MCLMWFNIKTTSKTKYYVLSSIPQLILTYIFTYNTYSPVLFSDFYRYSD